jgi:hypothetical protein
MAKGDDSSSHDSQGRKGVKDNGLLGVIHGMAFIGGAVYYIQHADTIWTGVLGVIKALFWPGVLMFKILELLKMSLDSSPSHLAPASIVPGGAGRV